jgi:hypothetical protein
MQPVYQSIVEVLSIAELCADRRAHLPSLILAYSAMDSMGWMYAASTSDSVKKRFTSWVDRYALPSVPRMKCTSLELYAARCGVLHTFTADSDLSARGVRKILYAWGAADLADLEAACKIAGPEKWAAVHITDVTAAARLGTAQMFEDSLSDETLAARLAERSGGYFDYVGADHFAKLGIGKPAV